MRLVKILDYVVADHATLLLQFISATISLLHHTQPTVSACLFRFSFSLAKRRRFLTPLHASTARDYAISVDFDTRFTSGIISILAMRLIPSDDISHSHAA
jgi:hypothetical protein